jgi:hypothetical protein
MLHEVEQDVRGGETRPLDNSLPTFQAQSLASFRSHGERLATRTPCLALVLLRSGGASLAGLMAVVGCST